MKKLLALMIVAALCTAMLIIPAVAAGEAPALPTATVTPIPEDELPDDPLTFALKFVADEASEEQLAYYAGWYADFELTVNKTATFNASGEADGYLAGEYGTWGWINVPFEDVTLEADHTLKIMEYAASLMGQSGLKYTYGEVYEYVKEFNCGVFFTEEFLTANTDFVVTLALRVYNPEDETESYPIGPVYTFYAAAATITDAEENAAYYATLEEAIEAAKDGDTIVLRNNVTMPEGETVTVDKNITIDLNGCTVTNEEALVVGEGKCVKVDGEKYTVNDHDQNTVVAGSAATCTADGKTEGAKCSVCGTVTKAQETIPAAGHKLTKVDGKAATYTEAGNTEHYICSVCGEWFADAEGKTAITDKTSVVIPMLIKLEEEKAAVSDGAVDTAITEAAKGETTTEIVLDLNKVAQDSADSAAETPAAVVSAQLPVASLEKVAELDEKATLTVAMKEATVTMDAATMAAVTEQAEGSTVTLVVEQIPVEKLSEKQQEAVKSKEVVATISAQIICDTTGNTISDFKGGNVTVQIPFAPEEGTKGEDYAVYYVADDGSVEKIETKYVNGHLVVTLEHFSEYVIVNTKANADPTNPGTGDLSMAPVIALMMINTIGAAAVVAGKKRFF